jgi:hypothetical protein
MAIDAASNVNNSGNSVQNDSNQKGNIPWDLLKYGKHKNASCR